MRIERAAGLLRSCPPGPELASSIDDLRPGLGGLGQDPGYL